MSDGPTNEELAAFEDLIVSSEAKKSALVKNVLDFTKDVPSSTTDSVPPPLQADTVATATTPFVDPFSPTSASTESPFPFPPASTDAVTKGNVDPFAASTSVDNPFAPSAAAIDPFATDYGTNNPTPAIAESKEIRLSEIFGKPTAPATKPTTKPAEATPQKSTLETVAEGSTIDEKKEELPKATALEDMTVEEIDHELETLTEKIAGLRKRRRKLILKAQRQDKQERIAEARRSEIKLPEKRKSVVKSKRESQKSVSKGKGSEVSITSPKKTEKSLTSPKIDKRKSVLNHPKAKKGSVILNALDWMQQGSTMLKYGKSGKPHFRFFEISSDGKHLLWYSTSKHLENTRIPISSIKKIIRGQNTSVFARYPLPKLEYLSWSILYSAGSGNHSLNMICRDKKDYQLWVKSMRTMMEQTKQAPRRKSRISEYRESNYLPGELSVKDDKQTIEKHLMDNYPGDSHVAAIASKVGKIKELAIKARSSKYGMSEHQVSFFSKKISQLKANVTNLNMIRKKKGAAVADNAIWAASIEVNAILEKAKVIASTKSRVD